MYMYMSTVLLKVIHYFTFPQTLDASNEGTVQKVSLILHGTKDIPHHVEAAGGRRTYNLNYNNVHNTRDVRITFVIFCHGG